MPELGNVENHRTEPGMNVAAAKARSKPDKHFLRRHDRERSLLVPAKPEKSRQQNVSRRMIMPAFEDHLGLRKRHRVDHGDGVSAAGGEIAVEPAESSLKITAAGSASPVAGRNPEPVSTAFRTMPAFPRSSSSSTSTAVRSG